MGAAVAALMTRGCKRKPGTDFFVFFFFRGGGVREWKTVWGIFCKQE